MTLSDASDGGLSRQAADILEALRLDHADEAHARFQRLRENDDRARDLLVIPVLIAIQRGEALDALRMIDDHPPGHSPGLRALCLRVLGDPSWHGEATALLESEDPAVVKAMRELLSLPDDMEEDTPTGVVAGGISR